MHCFEGCWQGDARLLTYGTAKHFLQRVRNPLCVKIVKSCQREVVLRIEMNMLLKLLSPQRGKRERT